MTYSTKLSAHYLDLAKSPVSAEKFAGEDARYSSEYEALECELGKAQSMHESGQIDWLQILETSENVLRTQSKDLRVGAWLAWALYQRESFPGLLAGLGLLHHLCKSHWAEIYPLKSRTRSAALSWLVPRLEQVLNENIAIKKQLPLFRRLVEHLEGLDAACTEHLGDDAPFAIANLPSLEKLGPAGRRQSAGTRGGERCDSPGQAGRHTAVHPRSTDR
jgi:type VI secretion system protein VasJ